MTTQTPNSVALTSGHKAMLLICGAHFFSHFYMLILPALLPILTVVYDVGFTELGFAITAYSLATGILQAPVGALIDRFGARHFLVAALFLTALSFTAVGLTSSFNVLLLLMLIAGLANSIFHPANYSILNASVPEHVIGRAFSLHSFSGQLGNAAGPIAVLALLSITDFRTAMIICGGAGLAGAVLLALHMHVLSDAREHSQHTSSTPATASKSGLALLLSAPILLGFVFFALTAVNHRGMTGFGVASVHLLHSIPLTEAGIALGAYLLATPGGVLTGGWLADRTSRHSLVACAMFSIIAGCLACLAALPLNVITTSSLFFIIGFCQGVATPARDMMIRAATPPRAMGRVFGFVSSGLNLAGVITPPILGYMLDHGSPSGVFWLLFAVAICTLGVALLARPKP